MEPFALILAAILAQTSSDSNPPPPPMPPVRAMMLKADSNRDGVVTRQEALTAADLQFARMDTNHDGMVTRDERRAAMAAMRADGDLPAPPHRGDRKDRGDRRGPPPGAPREDRAMTLEDYRARAAARFDRMDSNHDGRIDATELAAPLPPRHRRIDDVRAETAPSPAQ